MIALAATVGLIPALAAADGFYWRVGLGFGRPADTQFTDRDCSSVSPAALYGCGAGPDGAPLRAAGDFDFASGAELGVGWAVSSALRIEALAEHWPRFAFEGTANFLAPSRRQSVLARVRLKAALLAVHVALDEIGMPKLGPFRPFAGAGVGAARVSMGQSRMNFPRTSTLVPGGDSTHLAWMFTAGLELPIDENATLEVAWRYTDYGAAETGQGAGEVVWRDASRAPLPLILAPTRAELEAHALRLSLRVSF